MTWENIVRAFLLLVWNISNTQPGLNQEKTIFEFYYILKAFLIPITVSFAEHEIYTESYFRLSYSTFERFCYCTQASLAM